MVPHFIMTSPVSFTGTLTPQDTLDLRHYRMLCIIRRPFRWLIAVVSASIAALCIFAASETGFSISIALALIYCFYFPFGWFLTDRLSIAHRYRKHPEHFIESTVTLNHDFVTVSNKNMDLRLNWNQLSAIVSTPRGLLFLMPSYAPLFWLPKRLFDRNSFKEKILKIANDQSVPIKQMN